MKKVLLTIFIVVLILAKFAWLTFMFLESGTEKQSLSLDAEFLAEIRAEAKREQEAREVAKVQGNKTGNEVSEHKFKAETCQELTEQYPAMESQFMEFIGNIWVNYDDLDGTGNYSTMPIESLKSLVKAKDTGAMVVQGVDLMWQGAIGVRAHNQDKTMTAKERLAITDTHQMNFDTIQQGEEMLYEAALLGRYGGLMEVVLNKGLVINRMIRRGVSVELVVEEIINREAYALMWMEVHAKDPALFHTANIEQFSKESKQYLSKLFPNLTPEEVTEYYQEQQKDIVGVFADNINRWLKDRKALGEKAFPQLLTGDLKMYAEQASKLCWGVQ